ncbi:MAG: hypothetical protein IPJ62_20580 [Betaproteobacteria bacterium]|nr:hypothetical protein [Betaproteobacteria bacterium]
MNRELPISAPASVGAIAPRVSQWVKHVFWGGAVGLVVGLAAAFVLALLDGQAKGLSPGSCVAYGCALTVLFSHPAGLGGMLIGAALGALSGGGLRFLRRAGGKA